MRQMRQQLPSSQRVATKPLGDVEAVDATMIAIVGARCKDAAGRRRCCIIWGRDATMSHRTKCVFCERPRALLCVVCKENKRAQNSNESLDF